MDFTFTPTALHDVLLVEHQIARDARGFFLEAYRAAPFADRGIPPFVQDNHSRSTRGVLRGLHYQNNPRAIGKLVRCLRGQIFDVAIDIRMGSPTYGRWVGVDLSEDDTHMLYVPPGFAHGFCTVSDVAEIFYKVTDYYSPEHDRAILWNDPDIGIRWPISDPIVSGKDAKAPPLRLADNNLRLGVA